MAYLHPGVYVEEIPSGSKPIEGVGTSTAAFVGYATKGPIGEPNLISKWDDYVKEYGGVRNLEKAKQGDPMGLSVAAFFQNGGTKAYIVRITSSIAAPLARKAVAYVDNPQDSGTGNALKFSAINQGAWANDLIVKILTSTLDNNLFDVAIGRNIDNDKDKFSPIETYSSVSLDSSDPMFITNVIDGVSELVTVELDVIPSSVTSDEFLGTSTSGELSDVSLDFSSMTTAASRRIKFKLDGATSFDQVDLKKEIYSDLIAVANDIQDKVRALAPSNPTEADVHYTNFTCVVDYNRLVLTSGSREAVSEVVINVSGIATTLKLGITTVNYTATSTSGDLTELVANLPLALSDTSLFPLEDSRKLIGVLDAVDFTHLLPDTDLNDLNEIATAISGITGLTCTAVDNKLVLTSDSNSPASAVHITSDFGLAPILKLGVSTDHDGAEVTGQQFHDANLAVEVAGQQSADVSLPKDTLDGGTDGVAPSEYDYDKVFTKFIKYRDINIICLPGQHWTIDGTGNPVIQKAIGHAEKMKSRMVIIDLPPTHELTNPKMVKDMELPSQTYCVVYYPWVEAANRFYHAERFPGLPKKVLVPPSGYAAGMWAKIDGKRGVWKAPAGTETGLLGLAGLEFKVEDDEQDSLNPWGLNCLRSMPGSGKVIWGSRTRATKADPEWRYVPVRRTAMMIEQSIYGGIQWAVFEPNDHRLWSALRSNIGGFMNSLFRVGAFQGEKASDAYFVRCGLDDTMTQAEIDAGQVIVIVGFAPLKPAEFVIVRIQQKVNQQ